MYLFVTCFLLSGISRREVILEASNCGGNAQKCMYYQDQCCNIKAF